MVAIRVHAIRAIGAIRDDENAPLLLARLQAETDPGLGMAYASALGNLGETAAVPALLTLLHTMQNEGARMELALDLARIVGDERQFVQLVRQTRTDAGTALCNAMHAFKKTIVRVQQKGKAQHLTQAIPDMQVVIDNVARCADQWAADEQVAAMRLTGQLADTLATCCPVEPVNLVLRACAEQLAEPEERRMVYVLLAVHILKQVMLAEQQERHVEYHSTDDVSAN